MNAMQKIIDEIDCELYSLGDKAYRLSQSMKLVPELVELYRAIDRARSISFSLLPEKRRAEVRG